jgi:hypothetical protein
VPFGVQIPQTGSKIASLFDGPTTARAPSNGLSLSSGASQATSLTPAGENRAASIPSPRNTTTPSGLLSNPGLGERTIEDTLPLFSRPGKLQQNAGAAAGKLGNANNAENYWRGVSGRVNAPRSTQQMFTSFMGNRPDISTDAGLGPYFDEAKKRAIESIDTASAARGGYSSSFAADQINDAVTALEAQRALQEGSFTLDTLAEQRAWEQLGGSLAGQADAGELGMLGLGGSLAAGADAGLLASLGLGANIFGQADMQELARLNALVNTGVLGQELFEGRYNDMFTNILNASNPLAALTMGGLTGAVENDQELMGNIMSMILGRDREDINQADKQMEAFWDDLSKVFSIASFGIDSGIVNPGGAPAPRGDNVQEGLGSWG